MEGVVMCVLPFFFFKQKTAYEMRISEWSSDVCSSDLLALIGFVQDYLGKLGIECRLVHDEEKRKANLYATLGPSDRPGIMLSGHTDVVPVDGQDWATDPFQATEKEGRLYGRGTADMKSFLAIALAFAPRFPIGRAHV